MTPTRTSTPTWSRRPTTPRRRPPSAGSPTRGSMERHPTGRKRSMAELVLFHHAHGLTAGVRHFADALRGSGHTVHLPDMYDGRVFDTLDEGLAYAREVG